MTYLFAEGMLQWGFPVLYLALNLIAAEAVKRRSNHAQKEWFMALAVVVVSGFVQYWTLAHLPLKDYRPYADGESIVQNRMTAEELGLEGPEFDKEIRFFNAETGAETLVMQSRYMDEKLWDKNNEPGKTFNETYPEGDWENAKEVKIKDGYEQRIMDFQMVDANGFDLTDDILASEKPVLLHVSKDLAAMSTAWQRRFQRLGQCGCRGRLGDVRPDQRDGRRACGVCGPTGGDVPVPDVRPNRAQDCRSRQPRAGVDQGRRGD